MNLINREENSSGAEPVIHNSGQGARSISPWWVLLPFCAVSPVSIAATNMAWVAAVAVFIYYFLRSKPFLKKLPPRTDLDPALGCFFMASLLSVIHSRVFSASLL